MAKGFRLLQHCSQVGFVRFLRFLLNIVLPTMTVTALLLGAGTSGFLGSLFAQTVLEGRK
ncbi:hypothetical protein [Pseudohalocynthiibacter aestuariivivens]|jgi:hypothetical protein|uniref:hypothetical protein n=1 Tax=Pseudohalocynthiibacter aestuariivivens TaxID=1591409 RepID=UPI00366F037B